MRNTLPFVLCALCTQSISTGESIEALETAVIDAAQTSDLISKCLRLEKIYDTVVPLAVLNKLSRAHPENEQVAFLIVKFNDFNPIAVKVYLERFAEVEKKKTSFAEDFLEGALILKNMAFATEFGQYIENKLPKEKQQNWIKKLRELKEEYVGTRADSGMSLPFLYVYYVICTLANVAAAVTFIILDLGFLLSGGVMVGLFMVEVGILWTHNRWYGNRINLGKAERLLMTIFMCSVPVALGGVFLGALF